MFAVSMPNAATRSAFVETATKCCATASSPSDATSQSRAVCALVSVSSVVKVLETMTNSVSAGSRSAVAPAKSLPSTFETKRNRMSGLVCAASAIVAISGPRCDPPIPMFTTLRIGRPVAPVQSPDRTRRLKAAIRSSTSCTGPTTSSPSSSIRVPRAARSATCSTARSSETLIRSPANIAAIRSGSPASCAARTSSAIVSALTRCLA